MTSTRDIEEFDKRLTCHTHPTIRNITNIARMNHAHKIYLINQWKTDQELVRFAPSGWTRKFKSINVHGAFHSMIMVKNEEIRTYTKINTIKEGESCYKLPFHSEL